MKNLSKVAVFIVVAFIIACTKAPAPVPSNANAKVKSTTTSNNNPVKDSGVVVNIYKNHPVADTLQGIVTVTVNHGNPQTIRYSSGSGVVGQIPLGNLRHNDSITFVFSNGLVAQNATAPTISYSSTCTFSNTNFVSLQNNLSEYFMEVNFADSEPTGTWTGKNTTYTIVIQ